MGQSRQSLPAVLGLIAFVVVAYFVYDVVITDRAPCESIFEQTSAQFELKLKTVATEGNLVMGRQQVQELTDNAQITALNLKTCCIVLNAGDVDADQFLQCQAAGREYDAKLAQVLEQISAAQSAQQAGDQAAIEASRQSLAAAVREANAIASELRQTVDRLGGSDRHDGEPGDGTDDGEPLVVDEPDAARDYGEAVNVGAGLVPTFVVSALTRFSDPAIEEIFVVTAGTNLSSFTPVQRASEFGGSMIVEPGRYDVVLKPAGQSMVRLITDQAVSDGQQVTINADALVSYILLRPPTIDGFPALAQLFVLNAGSSISGYVQPRFSTTHIGAPLLVEPGNYDVYVSPADGSFVALETGVEIAPGSGPTLRASDKLAVIVHEDPQMAGFALEDIYVVTAGTNIASYHTVYQRGAGFGAPMLVTAGQAYDVVLKPAGGNPVKVQQNVTPAPGEILRFGGAQ